MFEIFHFIRWCLKYGSLGLAGTNLLTNISIINMYSKKFLFKGGLQGNVGKMPSVLICGLITPLISSQFVESYFRDNLLKSSRSECLMCKEMKATFTHLIVGSIMPTFFSWVLIMRSSSAIGTYSVPDEKLLFESAKARKFFFTSIKRIFLKTNQNVFSTLFRNYSIQFIMCSFVLFFQQKQFRETIEPLDFTLAEIKNVQQSIDTKK